jgi:hypothetical protein
MYLRSKNVQDKKKLSTKLLPVLRPAGGVIGSQHGSLGSKKHIRWVLFRHVREAHGKANQTFDISHCLIALLDGSLRLYSGS